MTPTPLRTVLVVLCLLASAAAAAPAPAPLAAVPRPTHPGAGQVFYFVLTDRFANGNTANDTGGYPGGRDDHGFDPTAISHYHGGDFTGLTGKLDYLRRLGVSAVWVTPPLKNKPVQSGTAGYHGYWITDFLQIDPHLGTNDEFRAFIRAAHARGLKVYMDIIANHTADVISYRGGDTVYRPKGGAPYRDAAGRPFDERTAAYNGLNDPAAFPALSVARSFAYEPVVSAAEANLKNPAWLNDLTLYHNRGNTTFEGENSVHGDFVGLDDLFTEHPRVVQGLVEIFSFWLEQGVDGFRIDTVKHVNAEFWQAFVPAIRARARALGRPDFLQFAEVAQDPGDPAVLAEFSAGIPIDTTLDFGFFSAARSFVSRGGDALPLAEFFAADDHYTDHDGNVHATTTFLGNHDAGRFAHFLREDNPGAAPAQLAGLVRLGHGLLFLARGQPVVYYGDEQGMAGFGNDMAARETMFASRAPRYRDLPLLGTARTGADDKFDETHPFYRFFARLAALRRAEPALARGAMLVRPTAAPSLFAFSRIERGERREFVVALNNSRIETVAAAVPTGQPAGAALRKIFDSAAPDAGPGESAAADAQGRLAVTLAPLQFAVWRAEAPLPAPAARATVAWSAPAAGATLAIDHRAFDGLQLPVRRELRAAVTGGDGYGEVTFAMIRASRPGQFEYLGTDDTPPYRVFWRPPADLAPDETLTFTATFDDLRGHRTAAQLERIKVAPSRTGFGIRGATVPQLGRTPGAAANLAPGGTVTLAVEATGTAPLEYQWLRDGEEVAGATAAALAAAQPGRYAVLVRNREGTALSRETQVVVAPSGRRETLPQFPSRHVAARDVWVWLPPGYSAGDDRYPVIYAHDGQNLFDGAAAFGGTAWEIDRALERLIAAGRARPAIVVGIANTARRTEEYLPQKAVAGLAPERLAAYPAPRGPVVSDAYLTFLVGELKPHVDRTWRTRPGAADTFVLGSSMGGLISAYAVAEYPAVFGGAACLSTHWPAADGAALDHLQPRLAALPGHRFWFDHGTATLDAGYAPFQARLDAALRAAGRTEGRGWRTRVYPGAPHTEAAWRDRVAEALEFLLAP